MRYIRTKEGKIFDIHSLDKYNSLEPRFIIEENRLIIFDLRNERFIANHGEVLKQADNIEDLCDGFVLVDKELNHKTIIASSKGFASSNDYELYGAIWTEWGLKYVAKMNQYGEMELNLYEIY